MRDKLHKIIENIIPTLNFEFPYGIDDYIDNLYMENYHNHKMESNILQADCAESIENYAETTKEYKSKCLFSGEHGWQGNAFLTYKVAESNKLKYRHSTEAYWVKNRLKEYPEKDKKTGEYKRNKNDEIIMSRDRTNCHIILVAKNDEGRMDINYALSVANEDGYYYKPRLDLELLLNIPPNNVIVTSACIAGWKYDDSEEIWIKLHNHFKDNFYLEVQNHDTDKQKELNKKILRIAKENNIQIICGLDSHYTKKENSIKREQILKYKDINYPDENGWYLDYPNGREVLKRFKKQGVLSLEDSLRAIMNTNVFVNECEDIVFDRHFKIPCVYKDKTYKERVKIFKTILRDRYKNEKLKSEEKKKGIIYETKQITESNVVDYFLTNDKIIQEAIKNEGGILTTTSRGSSASFVVNKLLGFTTIDRFNSEIPIYPERFLTKERVLSGQMPDIDFNVAEQEPFVRASKNILGEHGCYPLLAIEKLKAKASWQLYAGANDVDFKTANEISKAIDKYNEKLKYADDEDKQFIFIEDYIPKEYLHIYRKSLEYQGITINGKAHACGHLLFDGDIRREIGLIRMVSESTGKSVLCVAMEGGYLDEFGYVKNDYLIVDSVGLTYEFFKSIDMEVPSFDELREMILGDKPTWDIYAKGITCCINQFEKPSTTKKAMKYKLTSLAESSAFISAIRPGFRGLINNFLNREAYSTGVQQLDELLADSYCYLLYQESIMKLLSYLGLPMTNCYETIKAISKKKYDKHPEKLQELKNTLIKGWKDKIGDTTEFNNIWSTVENFAKYGFNAPHSLSMGGDSAYEAWFKAHHTSKFYEVAIRHYQAKNKKDKIEALTKEAIKFYGYKLEDYKFGNDNRNTHIDDANKIIYPSLSDIKGFSSNVAEILYEVGKYKYTNFLNLLQSIEGKGINRNIKDCLIKLDYFKEFGKSQYLLNVLDVYEKFNSVKQIKKDKIYELGLTEEIVRKYSNKETEKLFKEIDNSGLMNYIIDRIDNKDIPLKIKIETELEYLGYIKSKIENAEKLYYVLEIKEFKNKKSNTYYTDLYNISTGEEIKYKISDFRLYMDYPFKDGDIIKIVEESKKPKKRLNKDTGKWETVPNEFNNMIDWYEIY